MLVKTNHLLLSLSSSFLPLKQNMASLPAPNQCSDRLCLCPLLGVSQRSGQDCAGSASPCTSQEHRQGLPVAVAGHLSPSSLLNVLTARGNGVSFPTKKPLLYVFFSLQSYRLQITASSFCGFFSSFQMKELSHCELSLGI